MVPERECGGASASAPAPEPPWAEKRRSRRRRRGDTIAANERLLIEASHHKPRRFYLSLEDWEEIVERNLLVTLILYLVVAFAVYSLAVQVFFWQLPRRKHVVPGTLVAFFGAIVGAGLFARLPVGAPLVLVGAALGALGFIFVAVKTGTPGSVVLTVDTEGVSGETDKLAAEGFQVPFVWPYHFSVEKYGTVIFELLGKPGTEVTIEFPPNNTPFGKDRGGKPRATFTGTVPGRIIASPTISPGRGKYTIRKKDPDTGEVIVNDPTWGTPWRKD
jgi:hypothetical protein